MKGAGCQKCSFEKIKYNQFSTKEFITKAKEVHGDKYDYSKSEYKKSNIKIKIICPDHGEFEQTPNSHLQGHHCPKCAISVRRKKQSFNSNQFIIQAKEIHGKKYDYSLVEYKNTKTKVKIICPEHGVFEQNPNSHLYGNGCLKCNGKIKLTDERFISKAREIHGNRYDYSKVNYINTHSKVKIICPIHGEFEQMASGHLSGKNCPKCVGGGG